jgi:hypothetical protein
MRNTLLLFLAFALVTMDGLISSHAQTDPGTPHLSKQGTAAQLIVDGKPFLALSGELRNNTASSLEYMEPVWPRLAAGNLNSMLKLMRRSGFLAGLGCRSPR